MRMVTLGRMVGWKTLHSLMTCLLETVTFVASCVRLPELYQRESFAAPEAHKSWNHGWSHGQLICQAEKDLGNVLVQHLHSMQVRVSNQ